ncbi:SCP-2 sterol transfer family protein [Cognatiyoonia koreensis]|uniref:SCP-2 sterol transfer family protein n=1 Tax=Cognatiyoonia koreensis TaxID=364200 RepID=A0A1I0PGL6_9RHOB|nr:SCP2 sterol-binding domain-containing protein [Cognatiyoonia koreensis]SEW12828.1 SCP-2 sterol transfer family protein [Cognatiyoonia koreensis]
MTIATTDEMRDLITARAKGRVKGSVRLEMPDLATYFVDETGAVESDAPADITLTAKAQVFHDIATGKLNPATAFMLRKLKVDGNPMRALKIGEILSSDS